VKKLSSYLYSVFCLFGLLGVIFIPASSLTFSFQNSFGEWIFGAFFEGLLNDYTSISSDSIGMYAMLFVLLLIACLLSLILQFSKKWLNNRAAVFTIIGLIFTYYLSSRMFIYGFDKIFKSQFYLPEPNTLYTPVGYLSKDILYWTSMGTSYWYNVIVGAFEVLPAILLLFRKTRIIGLLICLGVLLHVLAINIGFDISVKLYSMFLLLLTIGLLSPNLKALYQFLVEKRTATLHSNDLSETFLSKPYFRVPLKSFIILIILIDCLYIPISTSNFNDDTTSRPYLHGAYQLKTNIQDNHRDIAIKRVFVHRRGFIIFQFADDHMVDYQFEIDEFNQEFILTDYNNEQYRLMFVVKDDQLTWLYYGIDGFGTWLNLEPLDWRKLPALEEDFHWTIESY